MAYNDVKQCHIFSIEDPLEAFGSIFNSFVCIKEYGSHYNGHRLHTSDSGERYLLRCKKCGQYVLLQESEVWSLDKTYLDYIPVDSEKHAEELNAKYDGYDIENYYDRKILYVNGYDSILWHYPTNC